MLRSCFLSSFIEFRLAVSEEKLKMSHPIRARAAILFFPIGPKNTNSIEDVEILLPVKFRWIPFSRFRNEVENVSSNQTPGWPSCFTDRPEKHILAPLIDGSRFLPVLGNSIRNWWSRTLCNLTRGGPLVRFICGVTSENLIVHYFTLMLELKFTKFVILKNKYNC